MKVNLALAPLSVNKAYRGRRFATNDLKCFKRDLSRLLPKTTVIDGKLQFIATFGISDRSDLDNCLKTTLDCLAEHYGFNDKQVYEIRVTKEKVKRGSEFIEFELNNL